jgi:ADP-ribosylglycohydrolase
LRVNALERARLSLDGLSVGDAFGERFFGAPAVVEKLIAERAVPKAPWRWTDDTAMALAVVEILRRYRGIDRDALAALFAQNFIREPDRGYGRGARDILTQIHQGAPWADAAGGAFDGKGSLGNGSAMRAPPLGAFFADQPDEVVVDHAARSAEPTHAHSEGAAGAIAVALAAAWAARQQHPPKPSPALLEFALEKTPESQVRAGLRQALELARNPFPINVVEAAGLLGTGQNVSCMDTVPFCLWAAARHCDSYVEALWTTVAGLGDRDTTCAIVGGIVALSAGPGSIPAAWLSAREALP